VETSRPENDIRTNRNFGKKVAELADAKERCFADDG
jgi:hypothetical protein